MTNEHDRSLGYTQCAMDVGITGAFFSVASQLGWFRITAFDILGYSIGLVIYGIIRAPLLRRLGLS